MVANTEYCVSAGNTNTAVSNRIASTMSRVNGIYMRELGLYFQLIANNNLLYCTDSQTTDCSTLLPNADASSILSNVDQFISNRGISTSSFDIGHICFNRFRGLAGFESCVAVGRLKEQLEVQPLQVIPLTWITWHMVCCSMFGFILTSTL